MKSTAVMYDHSEVDKHVPVGKYTSYTLLFPKQPITTVSTNSTAGLCIRKSKRVLNITETVT